MGLVTTTVTREATKLIEPRRSMAKADELVLRRTLSHAPTRGIGGLCVGPGALPSCSACVGPVVRAEHDAKAECAMEVEDIMYMLESSLEPEAPLPMISRPVSSTRALHAMHATHAAELLRVRARARQPSSACDQRPANVRVRTSREAWVDGREAACCMRGCLCAHATSPPSAYAR